MSNKLRKQDCHTRRKQRHETKRRDKRESARAYSQPTPRSQRSRSNIVAFPTWFAPVYQSNKRKKVAA